MNGPKIPYLLMIGDAQSPMKDVRTVVDVAFDDIVNSRLECLIMAEVEVYLDGIGLDHLLDRCTTDTDDVDDIGGAWLEIAEGPHGERGPFGLGPWLRALLIPAARALPKPTPETAGDFAVEVWQAKRRLENRQARAGLERWKALRNGKALRNSQ